MHLGKLQCSPTSENQKLKENSAFCSMHCGLSSSCKLLKPLKVTRLNGHYLLLGYSFDGAWQSIQWLYVEMWYHGHQPSTDSIEWLLPGAWVVQHTDQPVKFPLQKLEAHVYKVSFLFSLLVLLWWSTCVYCNNSQSGPGMSLFWYVQYLYTTCMSYSFLHTQDSMVLPICSYGVYKAV